MGGSLNSGDFYSTHRSDNVYEAIREELYRGNKHSRLEHRWAFNVTGGSTVNFFVEAWHDSTAEDFWFEYSTDQLSWTSMLTTWTALMPTRPIPITCRHRSRA